MASYSEAAKTSGPKTITEIALEMGLCADDLALYGPYKAKVSPAVLDKRKPKGKYVVVTSMTPAPREPDLTTATAASLGMALFRLGHRAAIALRQLSLDPLLHLPVGGPRPISSQLIPAEEILLHLTGDMHAVAFAHNLLAASVDSLLRNGNDLQLDLNSISWSRVTEFRDPSLRQVVIGLGRENEAVTRESSFETVSSSQLMAILALASSVFDLKERIGRIVIGNSRTGHPITVNDLNLAGTLAALLQEALAPNLVQTSENSPAFVHTHTPGIAGIGSSSILADRLALALNDYVVSESPFGTDIGMERFFDIKCRVSGLTPDAVVLVASIRGLKFHGGSQAPQADQPMKEDVRAVEKGCENLIKHIENANLFGVPVVVAVTSNPADADREMAFVERVTRIAGAEGAFVTHVGPRGGSGAISLAEAVVHVCKKGSSFKFLYAPELPLRDKIERIAEKVFGASGVDYGPQAEAALDRLNELGYGKLPVCMIKTPFSLSHDQRLRGRPRRYQLPVLDVYANPGAGYVSAVCNTPGAMQPAHVPPLSPRLDIGENGEIVMRG